MNQEVNQGVRAILFDMDGTLVDTEGLWRQAEREVASAFGVTLEPALQASFEGQEVPAIARVLRDVYGLPAEVHDLERALNGRVLALLPEAREVTGARELVAWVAEQGLKRAVVSNSPRHVVEATLAPHPWAAFLPQRYAADEVARGKPAPDLYLLAAQELGVRSGACIVLEDSPTGAAAALAAGMRCLAVPSSPHARRGMEALGLTPLSGLREALEGLRAWVS